MDPFDSLSHDRVATPYHLRNPSHNVEIVTDTNAQLRARLAALQQQERDRVEAERASLIA
jgi:hypothetical protein